MIAYALNLADLALTFYALQHGGVGLNPLLQSVPVMVAWKVCGVGVGCWMLHVLAYDKRSPAKPKRLARRGLNLCTVVYTVLLFYHFYFIGGAFYV
jgi:hypothetical protein